MTHKLERIPESNFEELPPKGQRKGNTAVYNGKRVRITKAFKGKVWIEWDEEKNKGALTSLNISNNSLGGYEDPRTGRWKSDMTGIKALAAAIPKCK